MSFVRDYVKNRSEKDLEFKKIWEEGKLEREIAAQLIGLRLNLGLNQTQFAELIEVKQSFLSRLENGEQNITIQTLQEIAQRAGANVKIDISLQEPITT
jgi:transcriptional regulator with XRE-family HTH domain